MSSERWWWVLAALVVAAFAGLGGLYVQHSRVHDPPPVVAQLAPAVAERPDPTLGVADAPPRTVAVYEGYGTWVDVFDFHPAYAPVDGSGDTPVTAADLADMAGLGVGTVYLQAARLDDRSPEGLVDPWLLTEWLLHADAAGVDLVGWYLPFFGDDGADLERLTAITDFEVLGRRFAGLAVDIEWIGDARNAVRDRDGDGEPDDEPLDPPTRSQRLVDLSTALRAAEGDTPLGAIVPPPVQTEVVNPDFWPGFPWRTIGGLYDVWLPMSYWSFRSDASGYGDGYTYHEESVRRLRSNVGDPEALVHGIGGIGGVDGVDDPPDPEEPLATLEEIERFAAALADTGSIGGSIYDWNTLEPSVRGPVADLLAR